MKNKLKLYSMYLSLALLVTGCNQNESNVEIEKEISFDIDSSSIVQSSTIEDSEIPKTSAITPEKKNYNEEDVVTTIKSKELEIISSLQNKSDETSETINKNFTLLYDFIFNGTMINGYSFEMLTLDTQILVLEIMQSLDKNISSHYPTYKEDFSEISESITDSLNDFYVENKDDLINAFENIQESPVTDDVKDYLYDWYNKIK